MGEMSASVYCVTVPVPGKGVHLKMCDLEIFAMDISALSPIRWKQMDRLRLVVLK